MLKFDQTTLANMTAALEYLCRKLPPDRDNHAVRKHIAEEIIAASNKGQTLDECRSQDRKTTFSRPGALG
jgi:hypothetical protein